MRPGTCRVLSRELLVPSPGTSALPAGVPCTPPGPQPCRALSRSLSALSLRRPGPTYCTGPVWSWPGPLPSLGLSFLLLKMDLSPLPCLREGLGRPQGRARRGGRRRLILASLGVYHSSFLRRSGLAGARLREGRLARLSSQCLAPLLPPAAGASVTAGAQCSGGTGSSRLAPGTWQSSCVPLRP